MVSADDRPIFGASYTDNFTNGNYTAGDDELLKSVDVDTDAEVADLSPAEAPVAAPTVYMAMDPSGTMIPTFKQGDAPVVFQPEDISQPVFFQSGGPATTNLRGRFQVENSNDRHDGAGVGVGCRICGPVTDVVPYQVMDIHSLQYAFP